MNEAYIATEIHTEIMVIQYLRHYKNKFTSSILRSICTLNKYINAGANT